ncbi:MAG: cell wall anchor protein [Muribaculum sp.]|nr:cell wall anchor protein [Muribaculaceae bacterium]MCM1080350.1 cell wall anchor protein [Muribaculum sp.]
MNFKPTSTTKIKCTLASLSVLACSAFAAGPVKVTTSLDSAYIIMGKQTAMSVEIVQDKGTHGRFLNVGDTLSAQIEVARITRPDTSSISSDREEIKQQIILQSFDSGVYTINPLIYATDYDTVVSNALALKVIPVPVDSMATVHDYADTVEPNTKLWDYIPDVVADYWWAILLFALLVLVGAAVWVWYKKRSLVQALMPQKKVIPPYELAMQQLSQLKEEKLCENSREKEYYTRLTEILRNYLDRRFGINAMEMTSTQILHHLKENEVTKPSAALMKQILEMADFVKFAKVRPMPDDNVRAFNQAFEFVEETKPLPEPEEAEKTALQESETVKTTNNKK